MKNGIKTTEFWLSLLTIIIGSVISSGIIKDSTTTLQVLGAIMAVLTSLGYTTSRVIIKSQNNITPVQ